MHDPTAIFRFEEHDVYLPMVVLEELDAHKKGLSEASRNVRQVSRFLDDMMRGSQGADRPWPAAAERLLGQPRQETLHRRLYFQTRQLSSVLPDSLPGKAATMPSCTDARAAERAPGRPRHSRLQDINLRIKAAVLGVHAEDYYSDRPSRMPTSSTAA